jgi:TPR repeat protein
MNKAFLVVTYAAILLFATYTSLLAEQVPIDGPVAREHMMRASLTMLQQEKFHDLETMANELRLKKARFSDGTWKLNFFYKGIVNPNNKTEEEWKILLIKLGKWRMQHPNSVTANVAFAKAMHNYGWFARGTGYADKVTPTGWKLLEERQNVARQILSNLKVSKLNDCPERHMILLGLSKSDSNNSADFELLYNNAIMIEPSYYDFYLNKASHLLPRWSGEEGDWQDFADSFYSKNNNNEGRIIYARIHGAMWMSNDVKSFSDKGASWPKLKQGYLDIQKQFPDSPWNLNVFCKFACLAGDKKTARDLFGKIGSRPYLMAWGGLAEYDKWRTWAELPANEKPKVNQWLGTEEFFQLSQLANAGDAHSQFLLGEKYSNCGASTYCSNNILESYQHAVAWFSKAARQEHPIAKFHLASIYLRGTGGIKQNIPEAMLLNMAAAYQGETNAILSVALAYYYGGMVLEKDFVKSYAWFAQIQQPNEIKDKVKASLSDQQLALAHQEANKIQSKIIDNKYGMSNWVFNKKKYGPIL